MKDLQTPLSVFSKICCFKTLTCKEKNMPEKWKSRSIVLCGIQFRFQNCLCFSSSIDSFWLLYFWRFKNTFYGRDKYIMHILSIIMVFEAINASYQGTIYFCMIFQLSFFILYIIFNMNLVVFYAIFYNDVTTLLWRHSYFNWP